MQLNFWGFWESNSVVSEDSAVPDRIWSCVANISQDCIPLPMWTCSNLWTHHTAGPPEMCSQHCFWTQCSSGMWPCAVGWVVSDALRNVSSATSWPFILKAMCSSAMSEGNHPTAQYHIPEHRQLNLFTAPLKLKKFIQCHSKSNWQAQLCNRRYWQYKHGRPEKCYFVCKGNRIRTLVKAQFVTGRNKAQFNQIVQNSFWQWFQTEQWLSIYGKK